HWLLFFFFSSRRRHTRFSRDWSSDVCSSDLVLPVLENVDKAKEHVSLTLKNLSAVQSNELTRALIKPIEHLLRDREISQQHLGQIGRASCRETAQIREIATPS